MAQHAREGFAFLLTASHRVWKRNADKEREGGLDGVVEAHPCPLGVGLVVAQKLPNGVIGEKSLMHVRQLKHFRHHQQHDQATVSVDRNISLQLLFHDRDSLTHSQLLHGDLYVLRDQYKRIFIFREPAISF